MPTQPKNNPTIPIEDVAAYPLPGMIHPIDLTFSPDDRLITGLFSPERSMTRQLYAFDPQSGAQGPLVKPPSVGTTEENVSLEEALRRERARQLGLGVTQYTWAAQKPHLLLPSGGNLYVSDEPYSPLRKLVEAGDHPLLDPQISPDGEWVAFVQDAEVYVVPFTGGTPRQLTHGARGTGKTNGLAEFVAQEEMDRRSGFWWSPDSRWIAFEEVDETHIPIYRIIHQGKDYTGEGAQEDHRYPFAGQPNALVRLGVISIDGGEPVWLDLGAEPDIYLVRVHWLPDGRLSAQIENRQQTELELTVYEIPGGQRKTLLREVNETWINLNNLFKPLGQPYQGKQGCFIWGSERSGFRHLYLFDGQGQLLQPLTAGEWIVDSLAGVDESAGQVYFTATLDDPRETHLYVVSLDGGTPRRITQEPGIHSVVLDHACQRFLDTHHSLQQPPTVTLRSLTDGHPLAVVYDQPDPRLEKLHLQPPELVSLQNQGGVTLYGAIFRPAESFGPGPYPTIVMVYGGPHAQLVTNGWPLTIAMRAQYLRSLGFLVFVLDNRGSARRGLAFEGVIKNDLGHLEVEDQADGVRWLVDQGLADPARVGIYGWSYGGYMSAMCLARAPETFKVAVAGAPTSNLDGYDTFYTERYMGTPQSNPQGYQTSSVMYHVDKMRGKLLLIHGLIDENVHFRHTARLINALIAARKPYDLQIFPNERHSPRHLADRIYMEERLRDYFLDNL
jgi:dipeptidyl-peptidase-4